jgi:hypothetical protein
VSDRSSNNVPSVKVLTAWPDAGGDDPVLDLRGPGDGGPAAVGELVAALACGTKAVVTEAPTAMARAVDVYLAILAGQEASAGRGTGASGGTAAT